MSRSQLTQRQRTQNNPSNLGTFSQTSLRYLKGTLGPQNKLIGYRDTSQNSNGGFGGGTYNHWFKIKTTVNSWIITIKGAPRPNYIQVSFYDLNQTPIESRSIFQADSFSEVNQGITYFPYVGQAMAAQSDLYNSFNKARLDQGDDRYFILPPGEYLLCVSTTRNEPLDYTLGLVIEVEDLEPRLQLETGGLDFFIYENNLDAGNSLIIGPTFSSNYVIATGYNAYTDNLATIENAATVTVPSGSTWLISPATYPLPEDFILLDYTENYSSQNEHQHSLAEWQEAWERDHQDDDRFPALFIPYTTTS